MKTAHLILVHKNPQQVERMIQALNHPDFDFFIHVDKKVAIEPFLTLATQANVFFIKKRVRVNWGGYSTIQATINGIVEICNTQESYNFINLLTGQDYPIKPTKYLVDFYNKNEGKEFLLYKDIVHDWKEAQLRYKNYHFTDFSFKGHTRIERILNKILPKRKLPYGFHPYGESSYWMLSPEVALYVVNKIQKDSLLKRFFLFTWGSDEFVFQTLILNSKYKFKVSNYNYRYIDWSEKRANPMILGERNFENIKNNPMLFARKFDITVDEKILNMIDVLLLS